MTHSLPEPLGISECCRASDRHLHSGLIPVIGSTHGRHGSLSGYAGAHRETPMPPKSRHSNRKSHWLEMPARLTANWEGEGSAVTAWCTNSPTAIGHADTGKGGTCFIPASKQRPPNSSHHGKDKYTVQVQMAATWGSKAQLPSTAGEGWVAPCKWGYQGSCTVNWDAGRQQPTIQEQT